MLTCDICGEEVMLEEDMKTHLLLNHLENEMHCPLCSLSGVSYDELCFHISTAHPENQRSELSHYEEAASSTTSLDCAAPKNTVLTLKDETQASTSGLIRLSNDTTDKVSPTATSSVTTDKVQHEQNNIENEASSSTMASSWTRVSPTIRQSVKHNNENGVKSEQNKDKRKRLCSPRKEKLFSCPMCALVCNDCFTLQEHVDLHLEEQRMAEEENRRYGCPLCSVVCGDSFSLQEHVELHLDHGSSMKCTGSPDSDLKLARRLHEEEEQRRKEEEAQQEREEFKKLQRQFGLDSSGGYRRQMERTMERAVARGLMNPAEFHSNRAEMMESLASGVDDGRTRTQGVLRALYEYYQTEARDCIHVWLSADTDHYCSSAGDKGWGCGYRNFQMLFSSLLKAEAYTTILSGKTVPSIPRVQSMIEEAWNEGLDPRGASHFNQRLQGTRAWIGATEIYSLLTSLGISARIIDFHQPTGPGNTHPRLFEWVKQYYCQSTRSNRIPPRLIQTSLPPLYLQHQGHSRSVVGLEQRKNGTFCLLVLDPSSSPSDTRKLMSRDTVSTAVRHIRKFPANLKHKQYQVVAVQGVLSAEDKRISILNSRTLCAERIP